MARKKDSPTEQDTNNHGQRDSERGDSRIEPDSVDLSRRTWLKTGATAVGFSALGSLSPPAAAASTTIDIVEAGADPTGKEPIDAVLKRVIDDDVRVTFPEGTYRIDNVVLEANDFELVGGNVRLVPGGAAETAFLVLSGDGWRVSGFEMDFRNRPTPQLLSASGGNWVFEKCVWRGRMDPDGNNDSFAFTPSADAGTTAVVRDVYMDNGTIDPGGASQQGCIWMGPNNEGTMRFERCWWSNWAENTVYCSNSAGPVEFVDCVWKNSNNGCPRIGAPATLKGCKLIKSGPIPERQSGGHRMLLWINASARENGAVGDITIEDTDFYWTDGNAAGIPIDARQANEGTLTLRNCNVHNTTDRASIAVGHSQPDVDLEMENVSLSGNETVAIDGGVNVLTNDVSTRSSPVTDESKPIPSAPPLGQTPDGSATSESNSGMDGEDAEALPNLLVVDGRSSGDTLVSYRFSVSGEVEKSSANDASIDSSDTIDGATVEGATVNWIDAYQFSGSISEFSIDGAATLLLNGKQIAASELQRSTSQTDDSDSTDGSDGTDSSDSSGSTDSPDNVLVVDGTTSDSVADYSFTVSGEVKQSDDHNASIDSSDTIDGSTVDGATVNWIDAYQFSGSITEFRMEGEATLLLNGQEVTPTQIVTAESDDSTDGSSSSASDGSTDTGDTDSSTDTDDGSDASGGSDTTLPNTLTFRGTRDVSEYEFTVSGDLEPNPAVGTFDAEDAIDGQTASGTVAGGVDSYVFSGEIISFLVNGNVEVRFD